MNPEQMSELQTYRAYLRILVNAVADPTKSKDHVEDALFAFNISDDKLAKSLAHPTGEVKNE